MEGCEWGDCLSCYQEWGESPLEPLKTSAAGLPFYFHSSHLVFLGTDKFGQSQKGMQNAGNLAGNAQN